MEAIIEKIYYNGKVVKENHTVEKIQDAMEIAREIIHEDSTIKETVVNTLNNVVHLSNAKEYRREEADLGII